MRFKALYGYCPKCSMLMHECTCKPLVLEKKLIINQLTPDGKVIEIVGEMLAKSETNAMRKANIPEKDKFVLTNKRRESLKFYYHQGKPYLAMFVNAGIHVSSFFMGAQALAGLENFLHEKRKEILLNSDPPNNKEKRKMV